jgi:adenylate kinase family enzyme
MGQLDLTIVLLSGAAGAGKSSLAATLIADHGFLKISTSSYLTEIAAAQGLANRRDVLQVLGDRLDEETDYFWPIKVAQKLIANGKHSGPWLLDAVRKQRQVMHFKTAFTRVLHVHVTATEDVLRARYQLRQGQEQSRDAEGSYDELIKHPNEVSSRSLEVSADMVFDSHAIRPSAMADVVAQALGGNVDGTNSSDQRASRSG